MQALLDNAVPPPPQEALCKEHPPGLWLWWLNCQDPCKPCGASPAACQVSCQTCNQGCCMSQLLIKDIITGLVIFWGVVGSLKATYIYIYVCFF